MGTIRRWCAVFASTACFVPLQLAAEETRLATTNLRYDPLYILEAVARRMDVILRAEVPLPAILLESRTPLARFQHAIAPQWGIVPRAVSNAYAAGANEIYLTDYAAYYERRKSTLDDSLAHEFVHYLQLRYFNADLSDASLETDAIAIQEWFKALHPRADTSIARPVTSSAGDRHAVHAEGARHVD
jgi:hypothetical protein